VPIKLKACPCGYIHIPQKIPQKTTQYHLITIANSQPVTSHVEGVTDGDPIPTVQSKPVINKSDTSHKWENYKYKLNEKGGKSIDLIRHL